MRHKKGNEIQLYTDDKVFVGESDEANLELWKAINHRIGVLPDLDKSFKPEIDEITRQVEAIRAHCFDAGSGQDRSKFDPLAAVGGKKMQLVGGRDRPDPLANTRPDRAGDPHDHLARR